MTLSSNASRERWIPAGLFLIFLFLYLLTRTQGFTYDGLCYALDVEFASASNLFHPNHLLYTATSWVFWMVAQRLGFAGRAIDVMQALNAVVGAGAVAGFYLILRRKADRSPSVLAAALFGLSYAFWRESVDSGCYAWAGLAACLLVLLVDWARPDRAWAVGLLHGLIVLYHQMLILVAPCFLVLLGSQEETYPRTPKAWGSYLLALATMVVIPYGLVAAQFHHESLSDALYWALGPAGPPPGAAVLSKTWWSLDLPSNLRLLWTAMVQSLVTPAAPAIGVGLGVLLVVGFLVGLGGLLWRTAKRGAPVARTTVALLGIVVLLNLFQMFFAPGALRYRILFMPAWLALLVWNFSMPKTRPAVGLGALVLVLLGLINFRSAIMPAHQQSTEAERTVWLRETVSPNDFLLFGGQGATSVRNVYLAYFAHGIPARSLYGYLFSNPNLDMRELEGRIQDTLKRGGRIFFEKELVSPEVLSMLTGGVASSNAVLLQWLTHWKVKGRVVGPAGYDLMILDR